MLQRVNAAFLLGLCATLAACGEEPTSSNPAPSVTPQVAAAALGSWTTKAPIPTFRQGMAGAVVTNASGQDLFYTIGGSPVNSSNWRRVEAYNAATNRWIRRADLPVDRAGASAAAIGGKIYLVGGHNTNGTHTRTLYVYDQATNAWTPKANLPVKSALGISGVIAGKLYLLTTAGIFSVTQRLYRYDPATNAWTRLANPVHHHVGGIGGVIDGKFYVAWGRDNTNDASYTVDVYNRATNRWTTKLTQKYGRGGGPCVFDTDCSVSSAAGAVLNKQLYVIGGLNDDESQPQTFAYSPVANTWTLKADMAHSREDGPVAGTVRNSAGKLRIVIAGGYDDNQLENVSATEMYTP